jgi:DNA-binding PadR family transcriptional regulator
MDISELGRFSEPALLILTSLSSGAKHGYAMMEDIDAITGVHLRPGTLYGALSRLEECRWIEQLPADERRKPYRITALGVSVLKDRLARMEKLVTLGFQRLAA